MNRFKMAMTSNALSLVFLLLMLISKPSHAMLMISINPSVPLVMADVDVDTRVKLGAKFGLGLEVTKLFERQPIALGVFYQGFLFSSYGPLALNVNGVTVTYYPFGSPLHRKNVDGMVSIQERKSSVYVKSALGLAFMNFKDYASVEFGASAIAYSVSSGIEYPVSDTMTAGFEANYLTTFGGVSTQSTEDTSIPVGATGFIFSGRITFLID